MFVIVNFVFKYFLNEYVLVRYKYLQVYSARKEKNLALEATFPLSSPSAHSEMVRV